VPAACQALTIAAITLDSDTEGSPAALDWANGTAGAMAEAVGTGTNEVILQNLTISKKSTVDRIRTGTKVTLRGVLSP